MKAIFFVALFSTLCTYGMQTLSPEDTQLLEKNKIKLIKQATALGMLTKERSLDEKELNTLEAIMQRLRDTEKALAVNHRGSM